MTAAERALVFFVWSPRNGGGLLSRVCWEGVGGPQSPWPASQRTARLRVPSAVTASFPAGLVPCGRWRVLSRRLRGVTGGEAGVAFTRAGAVSEPSQSPWRSAVTCFPKENVRGAVESRSSARCCVHSPGPPADAGRRRETAMCFSPCSPPLRGARAGQGGWGSCALSRHAFLSFTRAPCLSSVCD